ncbi:hypothetical protein [uncultured Desulfobacter sp.]|uniref:hypothetical protein n=1 Tax=uncultured Desulfobacter sp. TaxID=240139 RepID=UPI002AAB786E|nr:hypothetical protein [uncultured Desulfobacter sp.]
MTKKIKPVLICLLAYFILSVLLNSVVDRYAKGYLPVISVFLNLIYPDYFEFQMPIFDNEDQKVEFKAVLKGEVMQSGRYVKAQLEYQSSFSGSFLVLYPAITFALLIAWPGLSRKTRIISVTAASLFVYCMTIMDLSLFMMNSMESHVQIETFSQEIRRFFIQFFSNGGRQFMAIIIAWVAVLLAQWGFEANQ